ncbi:small s protein [Amylocarpus encephaloides]|uniref:Small s protein n=1 Tax=Amylocarpus encephaloides TaxID=45428 RepID=A0A9P7YAG4_9HELO|nr:small s protein [Amylocarpus encephaloides]
MFILELPNVESALIEREDSSIDKDSIIELWLFGAIGIASAFTACVDCFEYIQFGRHFGRDFQTSQLALNCARLRLTRWGKSVNIYDDPKLGRQDATTAEIQLAKNALLQILVLFADTESISKKYKLTAKAGEDLSAYSTSDMDPMMVALDNQMKGLAIQRQKKGRFLKLTSWALYHRSALKDLLEQTVLLLDEIERLFPAPQARTTFVQQEAAAIGDKQSLELIVDVATGVDSLLQKTVKDAIAGHQYSYITFGGKGLAGDAYSSDWKDGAIGASHKYDGIKVEEGGKGLLGNKYGGKDFFDD